MNSTKAIKIFLEVFETIVIALAISALLYVLFLIPSQVDGQSMRPTINEFDLVLTNKAVQWLGDTGLGQKLNYDYKRGDVIVYEVNGTDYIKRIIAKEDDRVMIEANEVYVNGYELDEKYIPTTVRTNIPIEDNFLTSGEYLTIPENSYFVLGDNRENSRDSRFSDIGIIPRDMIKGKVFFRTWPLGDIGFIGRGEYTELTSDQNL